jgi:hypothetical protein
MQIIKAERIVHRGDKRIALMFPFDQGLISLTKELPDARWSQSMQCWHVPDNKELLVKLSLVFRGKASLDLKYLSVPEQEIEEHKQATRHIEDHGEVTKPCFEQSRTLSQDTSEVEKRIQIPVVTALKKAGRSIPGRGYDPVEFTISEADGRLIIRFTGIYDNEWIKEIKSYGRVWFDPVSFEWLLGWSRIKVDSLADYFSSRGVEVIVKSTGVSPPMCTGSLSRR